MKFIVSFIFLLATCTASAQIKDSIDKNKKLLTVEASCGECQFKMKGDDCELAVRINGKTYFVDGTDIDSHGDAHSSNGFCEAIRKAQVQGEIVDNRFKVSYFKLLPQTSSGKKEVKH